MCIQDNFLFLLCFNFLHTWTDLKSREKKLFELGWQKKGESEREKSHLPLESDPLNSVDSPSHTKKRGKKASFSLTSHVCLNGWKRRRPSLPHYNPIFQLTKLTKQRWGEQSREMVGKFSHLSSLSFFLFFIIQHSTQNKNNVTIKPASQQKWWNII